jgi:tRNA pseudouridine55 synthase
VTIHALTLAAWNPPRVTLDVTCSAGTYIRSLAYDLGERLGVGAHLSGLRRTASGVFAIEQAVRLDDLLAVPDDWQRHLLPPDTVLGHLPAVQLDEQTTADVINGRAIPRDSDADEARAYTTDGRLSAILRARGANWQPHKVFVR